MISDTYSSKNCRGSFDFRFSEAASQRGRATIAMAEATKDAKKFRRFMVESPTCVAPTARRAPLGLIEKSVWGSPAKPGRRKAHGATAHIIFCYNLPRHGSRVHV